MIKVIVMKIPLTLKSSQFLNLTLSLFLLVQFLWLAGHVSGTRKRLTCLGKEEKMSVVNVCLVLINLSFSSLLSMKK